METKKHRELVQNKNGRGSFADTEKIKYIWKA